MWLLIYALKSILARQKKLLVQEISDWEQYIIFKRMTFKTITCWKLLVAETLEWRHNEGVRVPNHRRIDSLVNRPGEFPAQMASNAENDLIWWRHHESQESRYTSPMDPWVPLPAVILGYLTQ